VDSDELYPTNPREQIKTLLRMNWTKKGLVFAPTREFDWMRTHAALPVPWQRDENTLRVFFCSRDGQNRAQIGYFDYDTATQTVGAISRSPVIGLGPLGAFDDNGVTSSCIVEHEDALYQYYTGWNLGVTVPFYFYVGLAVSRDGGETFQKVSPAPVLGRTAIDPFLTASPFVLIENGIWRMWYVSAARWILEDGKPKHYYHVRYAESSDGIHWEPTGRVCIDFKSEHEYAIARPCVLREGNTYKMWYSCRGDSYRIGYAESRDGLQWTRMDERAGIDVSPNSWDSDMLAYPYVVKQGNQYLMFYNGNGYGRNGIGLAVSD
jgi:hypothetical protein